MKKVFLEDLPKTYKGIDWSKCIGKEVTFIYDDIKGSAKIIDFHKGSYLTIENSNGDIKKIRTCDFIKCKLGTFVGKVKTGFNLKIGDKFLKEGSDCTITALRRVPTLKKNNKLTNKKWCDYHCNVCNYDGTMLENSILKGYGCACCSNSVAVLGINTIWDTDRWMCDLGLSEEDAKKYTKGSSKKVEVICKDCGRKKRVAISKIYSRRKIGCICGDGFSMGEKIMYSLLMQAGFNFEVQYSPKWANRKRYDFYISDFNMIIETHGGQHYNEHTTFESYGGRGLSEEKENDTLKLSMAKNNGVNNYVVIDCSKSDFDFIKESILSSELCKWINLNEICWNKCLEFATRNIYKYICEVRKNDETKTTFQIAQELNLKYYSVLTALKIGAKLGWCNYDAKVEIDRTLKLGRLKNISTDES